MKAQNIVGTAERKAIVLSDLIDVNLALSSAALEVIEKDAAGFTFGEAREILELQASIAERTLKVNRRLRQMREGNSF